MTKRTITCLVLAACFAACALSGCQAPAAEITAPAQQTQTAHLDAGVKLTDMGGNEISLAAPAARIVALTPADCEILYAIGAGDALVGCGEYCDYPPEAAEKPCVQTGVDINVEQVLSLKPDVLLLNPQMLAVGSVEEAYEQTGMLESAGIQTVISDAQDIAGVYRAIEMLGVLTGHADGAESVARQMRETFAEVEQLPAVAGKTVYFEISPLEYGLWTAGTGTFMNEVAEMLGLTNCFQDVSGYGEVSEEQVIARDPDYIVTVTMYFGEGPTPQQEICARAGWDQIAAVRTEAVFQLQNDELSRPGPRLAEGARLISEWIASVAAQDDAA